MAQITSEGDTLQAYRYLEMDILQGVHKYLAKPPFSHSYRWRSRPCWRIASKMSDLSVEQKVFVENHLVRDNNHLLLPLEHVILSIEII